MRRSALLLLLFPLQVCAAVSINEIMYDLPGADTGREWIEIVNTGEKMIDLSGWKFFEGNSNHGLVSISGKTMLNQGEFAVIAANSEKFKTDNPSFSGLLFDSSFSLNNTGETVMIRNSVLIPVDSVTYSKRMGASENSHSLQKIDGIWGASIPTPGLVNVIQKVMPVTPSSPKTPLPSTVSQTEKSGPIKTETPPQKSAIGEAYVLPGKFASITPESVSHAIPQTAAVASEENPLFPWIIALCTVVGVPIVLIFLAKPKRNEADEIEILQ